MAKRSDQDGKRLNIIKLIVARLDIEFFSRMSFMVGNTNPTFCFTKGLTDECSEKILTLKNKQINETKTKTTSPCRGMLTLLLCVLSIIGSVPVQM